MLRFLGKTTSSAARSGGSTTTEAFAVGDDVLSAWELVNASQSDEEDLYSYDSDGTVSTVGEMEPAPTEEEDDDEGGDAEEDAPARRDFVSAGDLIAIQAMSVSPPMTLPVEMARNYAEEYCDDVVDDDDDDDVDDDYDVDDELVPWKLKGRFGKQRIQKMGVRKMGQRGGPKLTAKKLPYYDNRPGFPHGKRR